MGAKAPALVPHPARRGKAKLNGPPLGARMYSLAALTFFAFFFSLVLTPFVRNFAISRQLFDHPDAVRKLHGEAIPRLGGIAIFAAYLGAYALYLLLPFRGGEIVAADKDLILNILPAGAIIFAVGLVDDLISMPAWAKLAGQTLAAISAYFGGVRLESFIGMGVPEWVVLPVTLGWLVVTTNAINLIDGMDGLAAGVSFFASTTMLISALLFGNLPLALATAPLAAALLGFLRYNFNPATIFLGDAGSLTIGFLLGCFGIIWSQKSATILSITAPLIAMALPLLDVALSIGRRFLRGQPIFAADRGHIHHRLLARGLSVRNAAILLYGSSLFCAVLSLLSSIQQERYAGLILILFCAAAWIGVQHLGYQEFSLAGRMLSANGLRRNVAGQLILSTFRDEMKRAATFDESWVALRKSAQQIGFSFIEMQWFGQIRSEAIGSPCPKEDHCLISDPGVKPGQRKQLHRKDGGLEASTEANTEGTLVATSIPQFQMVLSLPSNSNGETVDFVRLGKPAGTLAMEATIGPFLDAILESYLQQQERHPETGLELRLPAHSIINLRQASPEEIKR